MKTAHEVAEYFLARIDEESGDLMSNLKLQKLVYYAQGLHLALHDSPLFSDTIVAWNHGPVVVDLYHTYSQYGRGPIPALTDFDVEKFTVQEREVLDEINTVYGQFSAWRLRDMTHDEGPWKETPQNDEITTEKITAFFKTQLVPDGEE